MAKAKGNLDAWGTSSGLLDNYDLHVKEAWFGENEESDRADGAIYLFLQGEAYEDGELVEEDKTERFGTGKGWEVVEEGAAVEHASGRNRFNRNSGMGRVVTAITELGADTLTAMAERGAGPFEAKVFKDTIIHFGARHVVSEWITDEGEKMKWEMSLPESITFGKAKGSAAKAKGGSKKAEADPADAKATKALERKLVKAAKEFDEDDHEDFLESALDEFPEVEDFPDLHADLLDDEGTIWTSAHK